MSFNSGDTVRIKSMHPPGHVRTPHFTRGKSGRIVQILGRFANPEALAYGRDGQPAPTLYRVAIKQHELWPDYQGPQSDDLIVDIYEHWLEPAHDSV